MSDKDTIKCETCGIDFQRTGLKYHQLFCKNKENTEKSKGMYLAGISKERIINEKILSITALDRLIKNYNLIQPSKLRIKDESIFEIIDTKEKAYWLGFLCADGCIKKDRCSLRLELSHKDEDQLDRFIAFLGVI